MTDFATRCGMQDAARADACARLLERVAREGIEQVRVAWCDLHGTLRSKTLEAAALPSALRQGVTLVGTLLLKDTSDRTAVPVFEPGLAERHPALGEAVRLAHAGNLVLLPDPASLRVLPWTGADAREGRTGWLQAEAWFDDGTPLALDPRRTLRRVLDALAGRGLDLVCGLEVEFHVWRIDPAVPDPALDPRRAEWPGEPPPLQLVHPGWQLLSEAWADRAAEPLAIVRRTALGLGLPLRSLEVELGPSQLEAVFEPTGALQAADHLALFRSAVRQALRRAGYHASFVCKPPFEHAMASGWHLHQSLACRTDGGNAFVRDDPAPGAARADAGSVLSDTGAHWLAGLMAHGAAIAALGTPTVNGFARYRSGSMAPVAVRWGRDNRGALLRVLGAPGDAATRIENRSAEPAANPYLAIAGQAAAGLDGLERKLEPPPATDAPYAPPGPRETALPADLGAALALLEADDTVRRRLGEALIEVFCRVKRAEVARHDAAEDPVAWQRREYLSRF